MKIYFVCVLIVLTINIRASFAQNPANDAHISGHVLDKSTGEHLPFVSVVIRGLTLGTTTDATGHFIFRNVPLGEYTIAASFIGYETVEQTVTVVANRTVEIDFELEESAFSMGQVVVTASRYETDRSQAVSIVGVVSPKIFETTGSPFLAEGLNFQPGLRVEQTCQNCGFPQLRINGLEGPYTQILIDSRPIFSALAGVYGLEHIPANMVERVEVVRGGASALYGSSAIGGVVNIITKETLRNSFDISNTSNLIYGKTPDIVTNVNASVVSDNNRAGVTFFAAARNREPFDYNGDGFSEIGKINLKSFGFRGFYRLRYNSRLTLEYHTIDEFRRGGDMDRFNRPPHDAYIAEQTDHTIHSGGAKYDVFSRNGKHALQLFTSAQTINRESYYGVGQAPDAYGTTNDFSLATGSQYTLRMDNLLFMPATFIGGFEYSHNALKDKPLADNRINIDQQVHIYSLFAQNEWRSEKTNILLGGRLDNHSLIDRAVIFSPRVSVRHAPFSRLNLRSSYAAGFRGPQAFDEDLHVTAVGGGVAKITLDEALEHETSHSFTISAEYSQSSPQSAFQFLAEGFYTMLNNVFVIDEEDDPNDPDNLNLVRRNGDGAVVRGVNLETNFATSKGFNLNAGFTLQSSKYTEEEDWSETAEPVREMFRAPNTYGYMTASGTVLRSLDLSLSGIYTGSMFAQYFAGNSDENLMFRSEDFAFKTSAFFDLHCRIAYNFRLRDYVNLQINAGMKNIFNSFQSAFDRGAERDSGFVFGPSLPRTVYVGVKVSM